MSKVDRSVYQKCAEENKKLKKDIEALVMLDDKEISEEVFIRWFRYFKRKRHFDSLIKQVIGEYKLKI